MTERFQHWLPVELHKSEDPSGRTRYRIRGIASTEHEDLHGDVLDQDGIDFGYALKYGFFNDDHDDKKILGYPERVGPITVRDPDLGDVRATLVEGWLLDNPDARRYINLADDLKGTPRQIGLSLQGDILKRDPNDRRRVTSAKCDHIALTTCPVNPHTVAALAKSQRLLKAMSAGYGPAVAGVAVAGSARPLMPQSLGGLAVLTIDPMAAVRRMRQLTEDWRAANGGLAKSAAAPRLILRLGREGATT